MKHNIVKKELKRSMIIGKKKQDQSIIFLHNMYSLPSLKGKFLFKIKT